MTKKLLLIILLLPMALVAVAQVNNNSSEDFDYPNAWPDKNDLKNISSFTIGFRSDGKPNSLYDSAMINALTKYWTICKWEMLPKYDPKDKNAINSNKGRYIIFSAPNEGFPDWIMIDKSGRGKYLLARIPVDLKNYIFILPNIIQEMQHQIELAIAHPEINDNSYDNHTLFRDDDMIHMGKLKDETLYIPDSLFNKKCTEEDFKAIYPYKYKVVSHKEIADAVKNQEEGIAYLYWIKCNFRIENAKGGDILYCSGIPWHTTLQKDMIEYMMKRYDKLEKN